MLPIVLDQSMDWDKKGIGEYSQLILIKKEKGTAHILSGKKYIYKCFHSGNMQKGNTYT